MKLFIGLPVYSQMPTQFVQCMFALQAAKPFPIQLHICQGDGVARSRNMLACEFLRSDCDVMLQIDCDLIFSPEHVARIVNHNVPVVGGSYPKKQDGRLEWVMNTLPNQNEQKPTPGGLLPVRYVGTGFLCVQRQALEQMRDRYPESSYQADYGNNQRDFEFFPMRVYREKQSDPGRYLSEDWFFCQRWLDMGGTVYLDTGTILRHIGPAVFPLQSQLSQITQPIEDPPAEMTSAA